MHSNYLGHRITDSFTNWAVYEDPKSKQLQAFHLSTLYENASEVDKVVENLAGPGVKWRGVTADTAAEAIGKIKDETKSAERRAAQFSKPAP